MTVNELVGKIGERVKYLANQKIDSLRSMYPETTETRSQLARHVRDMGLTKGDMINAIILEEFSLEFDRNIEEDE